MVKPRLMPLIPENEGDDFTHRSELAVQDVRASSQRFRSSGHTCMPTHDLNPNPASPCHAVKDSKQTTIMIEGLKYGE